MQKYFNGDFRNKSIDITNNQQRLNLSRGTTQPNTTNNSSKYQLLVMKKSNKPILVNKHKPIIRLVNHSININNIISTNMTNNIIINNYNAITTEGKQDKSHRKSLSQLNPVINSTKRYNKTGKIINTSVSIYNSATKRNIPEIEGFNSLVKDLSVDKSEDFASKKNTLADDILSDSNSFIIIDFRKTGSKALRSASIQNELNTLKDEANIEEIMQNDTIDCYDLSARLINDENKELQSISDFKRYGFINKIKDEIRFKLINSRSFLEIHENAMFNILSFSYPFYDKLIQTNKLLKKKIHMTLNNKFSQTICIFRNLYSDYLDLQEYYFKPKYIKKHQNIHLVLDLVLKSKIISNKINKCIEISIVYFYSSTDNSEIIQTWKFDIRKKNDIHFWFASETEEYRNHLIRYCYYQPIVSFTKGDYIEFRINVFSPMGIIDPESIHFLKAVESDIPQSSFLQYEKSLVKHNIIYDKTRFCELENVIHVWKNEKSLTRKTNINEFKIFFNEHFKIIDINYDFFKFYIFKIKLQAKKIGIIKRNKYTNFDIEIKPWSDIITNETQCMGLLNINHLTDKVEMRITTYAIFYFTDIYI